VKPKKPATGSIHVRVPATFVLRSGGRLDPPQISVPALLAVQLTVDSRDGRSHHVVLRTPTPNLLSVPANGHASILIPGLKAGRYRLVIDGAVAGLLITGAEPGP
jgi:hypothetical protein